MRVLQARFRNLPIKKKLLVLMISISSLALILAGTSAMVKDYVSAKEQLVEKHSLLAKLIAKNISAAVVFKDSNAATDVLSSIAGIDTVDSIQVESSEGHLIAKFQSVGSVRADPRKPASNTSSSKPEFEGGRLHLRQAITVDGETVGTIHLVANLAELYNELAEDLLIGALVTVLLILLSVIAASFLNGAISNPILALTETMERISREKDYGIRVPQTSDDEIGVLVRGFNAMLETVESRDEELVTYRESLEELVEERTRELEASQRRFIDGIEALPAGFVLFDGDRRLIAANSKYRETNKGIADLISPGVSLDTVLKGVIDRGLLKMPNEQAKSWVGDREKRVEGISDMTYASGIVVRRTAKPTREGGTVAVFTDITDLRRTEDELRIAKEQAEAASRSKSDFLANMSHEIRTPMNGVLGMADLLAKAELGERERRLVQTIRQSGELLLHIINDILDFSKIEAGKLELESQHVELRSCVEDVGELLAETAHVKGIELVHLVDSSVPSAVMGDSTRLRQVLTNLAGNAVKFTETGEIAIRVVAEAETDAIQKVRFEVRDTGIGIPAEQQSQIFKSFQQVDTSTSRRFGGTGLGLTISSQLVKMMGGEIGLESEPGKGSTFWFEIPFEISRSVGPDGANTDTSLGGLSVLIVDDNAVNRLCLLQYVEHWGMRGECAANGADAMELMHQRATAGDRFDLVVLDVQMPGESGIELGKRIRADQATAATPLILLSSTDVPDDEALSEVGPPSAFLMKPARQSALFNQIAHFTGAVWRSARPPISPKADHMTPTAQISATVLIAEDNPINQEVTRENLLTFGCEVDIVCDGLRAVEAWESGAYDLILMDCQMPEMDGFAATRAIREKERDQEGRPHTPIVALTAHAMEGDREHCLAAGMDDYLAKPFNPDDLYTVLRRWVLGDDVPPSAEQQSPQPESANEDATESVTGDPSQRTVIDPSALDGIRALRREGTPDPLARVITKYLSTMPNELQALQDAATEGDLDALAKIAHKLKSGSASLGALHLTDLFKKLEVAAKKTEADLVPSIVTDVNDEFDRVAETLESEIDKTG